jgi:hypothetical protein
MFILFYYTAKKDLHRVFLGNAKGPMFPPTPQASNKKRCSNNRRAAQRNYEETEVTRGNVKEVLEDSPADLFV